MKISGIETIILNKPLTAPYYDSIHTYAMKSHLLVCIHTDEGITGCSILYFGRIPSGMSTVKLIIDRELAPVLIGQDPYFVRRMRDEMFFATEYYGTVGVAHYAICALDSALWDIMGKAAGLPVAKLLGACRDKIQAYAMVGWYFENGLKGLVDSCIEAAEEGFPAVKIKVGRGDLKDDVKRIQAVRKELGDDYRIMVDANCGFDELEAFRRGYVYEELGVYWFEEPMPPHMRDSHVRLARKLKIPLAIGENYYTRHQFYEVIKAGCGSIIQPDNRRAGGVTEWMEIAAIADVAGLKVASHLGGGGNLNLMCAIPNALYLETGSLKQESELYQINMTMEEGCIPLPETPGMGNDVKEEYIAKYRVDE